jgi:cysteine desulfurase
MSASRIYADYNARSPLRPEAHAAIERALGVMGNSSSVHAEGRKAKAALEDARDAVAAAVGAHVMDVTFASGATEANNHALFGLVRARPNATVFLSGLEHESIWIAAKATGARIETIPACFGGSIDLDWLRETLAHWDASADGVPLVCLMLVNNETGVVQPVTAAADLAHAAGGYLLCDAVQALGRIGIDIEMLGADYLTLSAHKVGGLSGAGALIVRGSSPIAPIIFGGGQERGRRAGTENLVGALSFAAACSAPWEEEKVRVRAIRDSFEATLLREAPQTHIVGANAERVFNTSCVIAPNIPAEMGVVAMDLAGVACSAGSACSSGKVQASRVLISMGMDDGAAKSALRFSFGWANETGDGEAAAQALAGLIKRAQAQQAA